MIKYCAGGKGPDGGQSLSDGQIRIKGINNSVNNSRALPTRYKYC